MLITRKIDINFGLVLKNMVFMDNCIIITLTKLITEFSYSLVQYVLVILKFTTSKFHSLIKLFNII